MGGSRWVLAINSSYLQPRAAVWCELLSARCYSTPVGGMAVCELPRSLVFINHAGDSEWQNNIVAGGWLGSPTPTTPTSHSLCTHDGMYMRDTQRLLRLFVWQYVQHFQSIFGGSSRGKKVGNFAFCHFTHLIGLEELQCKCSLTLVSVMVCICHTYDTLSTEAAYSLLLFLAKYLVWLYL